MVSKTLRVTLDLLLLRRGPQDLPADWGLLAALAILYFCVHFVQGRLVMSTASALAQAWLATVLLALFVHGVLRVCAKPARFAQTLSALFAVGVVLTVLTLAPTAALAPYFHAMMQASDPASVRQPPAMLLTVFAALGLWSLVAFGHVYRHALETGLVFGVAVELGFELLMVVVFSLLGSVI